MATQRQINANRKHAQNSTGPTSPEGKAVSSQNAFRTGIDAQGEILSCENPDDIESLRAEYDLRFAPAAPEKRCLVDALIRSEWLLRHYANVEARVWEERLGIEESIGTAFSGGYQVFARLQVASIPRNALRERAQAANRSSGEPPGNLRTPSVPGNPSSPYARRNRRIRSRRIL
jgi:hypothetical protein